jgi:iron complex outermembrane receptor protein
VALRLGWRPRKDLELSLVGANLFGGNRLEFLQEAFSVPVEVEPSLYGRLQWSF